ncbi:microtubule-associated protein Jupiter-like [Drosophila montana]|uniref:microtubule-associated protein Jupiter-like n=1 Tax=Drosophila montana TaxID=40370 RepID=UPI00313BA4FB
MNDSQAFNQNNAENSSDMSDKMSEPKYETNDQASNCSRNPITGMGLNGDGVGGLKPKIAKNRAGNPVTGEGYKTGHTDMEVLRKISRRPGPFS